MRRLLLTFLLPFALAALRADGPADNQLDKVRRIPGPGVAIPDEARRELGAGVAQLGAEIESLRTTLTNKPAVLARLPDVQIFHKAVEIGRASCRERV